MSYLDELELIRNKNGGILRPEDVVEFAKNPKTALHKKFTWDNDKAAHEYRLWQARELIRVSVNILPQNNKPFRVYVSLVDDRKNPGGGYRALVDVMMDGELREKLLEQAIKDMRGFQKKYKELKELASVFSVMDETIDELELSPVRVATG